jgi:hypothetical protein
MGFSIALLGKINMQLNWPLIIVLFCLGLPGVIIAIPRLIVFFLPNSSEQLQKRVSYFAGGQTVVMLFLMVLAGSVLSERTGLKASLLDNLLLARPILNQAQGMILPVLVATTVGLVIFFILYYGVVGSILDEKTFEVMRKVRSVIRLDGCILYGGITEEIIARWGLMNVIMFFAILFTGQILVATIWITILFSGFLLALAQLPAYFAAGCQPSRRFVYSVLILSIWQAILFGGLFWQYGLIAAMIGHVLFHLGWHFYDRT